MTSEQFLTLLSIIAGTIGNIGLDSDTVKMLISKPCITKRRLKALVGETPNLIIPMHQVATVEKLDVKSQDARCDQGDVEYVEMNSSLKKALDGTINIVHKYGENTNPHFVHRCDVVKNPGKDGMYPVFRQVLDYQGPDSGIFDVLYERCGFWSVRDVLSFIYDEIHTGKDPLGFNEKGRVETLFPVLLTEKKHEWENRLTCDEVGLLVVTQGSVVRQKRKWKVSLYDESKILTFIRSTVFLASNPRLDG